MLRAWLYRIISRFIHENMGIEVSIEDTGNPNYKTLYVHLKVSNEVVASGYTKLEVKIN
ncbi:hypothetical protein SDC9_131252 [bioreactor metagenome]|uniref:Uncharacterized protein n=1 Tax=bioreactor metagenome TaxID=1076179 RepID=A0A645D4P6_9ZZZZ